MRHSGIDQSVACFLRAHLVKVRLPIPLNEQRRQLVHLAEGHLQVLQLLGCQTFFDLANSPETVENVQIELMQCAHIDENNAFVDDFLDKGETNMLISSKVNVINQLPTHAHTAQVLEHCFGKRKRLGNVRTGDAGGFV